MGNEKEKYVPQVTWVSYVVLLFVIVMFSGIFTTSGNFMKSIDFSQLIGSFGQIPFEKGYDFRGVKGTGAKDGFMMAVSLTPAVILALGIVSVCEGFGGLLAANKLMSPFFRALAGIPGTCGLAFIASMQSTDTGGGMTKELFDNGFITDQERTIFCQLQLSAAATVTNYFGSGALCFPFLIAIGMPLGLPLVLIFVMKLFGANMMRIYLAVRAKKEAVEA